MVVKKQLKKISKKILILGLATSIIFTSCFSTKKIEAHATSVVAGLSAYTLYQICMYIGGIAVTTLGIGYAYDNRDEIAEFGKSVIDSMTDLPALGWILGSHTSDGDYVYGTEALQEVQDTEWIVIQGGGNSPKNDNDGDGDKDEDDLIHELNLNGFFLTQAGINLFENHLKPLYNSWVNKEEGNILTSKYGAVDGLYFDGFQQNEAGEYVGIVRCFLPSKDWDFYVTVYTSSPVPAYFYESYDKYYIGYDLRNTKFKRVFSDGLVDTNGNEWSTSVKTDSYTNDSIFESTLPIFSTYESYKYFYNNRKIDDISNVLNYRKTFPVADWLADEEYWKGLLEDLSTSLRSLQDLSNIAQEFTNNLLEYKPTVNIAGDTLNDYMFNQYSPITNVYINSPTYYPSTNTTPHLDISVFPNYDININPDIGGGGEEPPTDDGTEEVPEIDLDGLLSIFNILFYLIMIIVMLIYLFLSCLAFIVMIFRIPASSSMMPEDMVLGYEHLKTIMIPGMNISIYGFAMALIYLFIIFAVIKLIRLEINDFKFPRSYK